MLKQWSARFAIMSVREKLILLGTVLVLLLFVAMEFVWAPLWEKDTTRRAAIKTSIENTATLQQQLAVLQTAVGRDPDAALKQEIDQLSQQLEHRENELRANLSRLVSPEEITAVLIDLLEGQSGYSVREVSKLPTLRIQQGEGDSAAVLYSHRVRIVIDTDYFNALEYLRKIERDENRLRLLSLRYEVDDYPSARLTLDFETLGLDERWLGV
ncbi:type II secretion system protein GspM [Allohahella sp. A8]|uniref:type II secretion system protein GspM n=1 Tax=Allohahella sp. A8 TaxID=3141461 RepID=UPI000C0AD12E|nr:hypothetical protein [Hahellaceae bacterium]|tara:strand:- start:181220 stop:181858 length:639 start_codon:yes stop_codon:yes gene_type:complete